MKITTIQAAPVGGKVRPELRIISSLGSHVAGNYVLVRIDTDEGIYGLGEATVTAIWSGETQAGTIAAINEGLAPIVNGADPFDVAWLERQWNRAVVGNSFAKSAVEMALLDLQGKKLGLPVCKLLGGCNPEFTDIRLKFVVGAYDPGVSAARARQMVDAGWKAIKVKVGRTANRRDDLDRVRAVREAIGGGVWLSIDANGAYAVDDAVWLSKKLEPMGVKVFEQPTRRGRHREMRMVRKRTGIPVMADESVFSFDDACDLLREEAADIISVYPGKNGGIRATQAIVRLAEGHGVPCTIGSNLEREVATAAMAHAVAATPNLLCEKYPGDLIGPLYFDSALTKKPLEYGQDRLHLPTGSGLGVDIV